MCVKIGIIGCGLMGKGIAYNYIQNKDDVYIYDTNPQVKDWIQENGGIAVDSLQQLGEKVEFIISSLPTVEAVKDVYLNALLNVLKPGSVIVDMSTTDAGTAIEIASIYNEKGMYFFDSPVSGGPNGARNGTLTLMVAGDQEKFNEILPILQVVGKDIIYLGKNGNGQIAKLCHNIVVASTIASIGEAYTVASKAGLDLEKLEEILSKGSASRVLAVFGDNILKKAYDNVLFSLDHMHKDVSLYTKTAAELQVPVLLGAQTYQLFEAAKSQGLGSKDTTAVCQFIEKLVLSTT
jgi:3-hydroxyisobutyrate dehydrogenase